MLQEPTNSASFQKTLPFSRKTSSWRPPPKNATEPARKQQKYKGDPQKQPKTLESSTGEPIHPLYKTDHEILRLKQLSENSTPTLRQNAIFLRFPQQSYACFGTFATPLAKNVKKHQKRPATRGHRYPLRGQKHCKTSVLALEGLWGRAWGTDSGDTTLKRH